MTTIGTTSYYSSAARYAGAEQSNSAKSDSVYDDFSEQQESELNAATAASTGSDDPETIVDNRPSVATFKFMGQVITVTNLKVDLKAINISELPEDQYQSFMAGEQERIAANKKYLESQYTQYSEPDLSNEPSMKPYATVVVGGKVVATIDNQGVVTSDDALGAKIRDLLQDDVNGTNGPDLAQARAEQIARMTGGRVDKASTAITQRQFDVLPPIEGPQATIDYEAMKKDPLYEQLQKMQDNFQSLKQQRDAYLAQQQAGVDALV